MSKIKKWLHELLVFYCEFIHSKSLEKYYIKVGLHIQDNNL